MTTFQHLQQDKYGGGGIYALYPFDSPLVRKKGVFKIGMALNFDTRLHQYDTGSPAGVYVVAYLKNPLKNVVLEGDKNLSKYEPFFTGSILVTPRQYRTKLDAALPLPGPTAILFFLAILTTSHTINK